MPALAGIAFVLAIHAADSKPEALLNPADRGYVNPRLCFGCQTAIYSSYMRTGMGRSFARPGSQNTVEDYSAKNSFYHEPSRSYFQMIRRDGKYYQRWYQLDLDGTQINANELSVDHVLGSAIHARACIHREPGGRLFQLPAAWYAKKGGYWWMAPGYDSASHSRAVWELDRATRLNPEDAVTRFNYASTLNALHQFDQARAQAQAAVRLNPNVAEARDLLGTLLERRGDDAGALAQ